MSRKARPEAAVTDIAVAAYRIPTDFPEADGTLDWTATTLVLVTIRAGGLEGLSYGYADTATAGLIRDKLAPLLVGRDALAVPESRVAMVHDIRNLGRPGIAAMAISILDVALWDLKAKLLGVSLADLLGRARAGTPAYGSGGFTCYPDDRLAAQLAGWAREGIGAVKMKIGRDAAADLRRVRVARDAIGPSVALYVDANGACDGKQALAQAEAFAVLGVTWFEEPVLSDDLAGLHLLRSRGPAGMEIAAGEYGYEPVYFRRM